ncbi:TolC family protein (plasmid) [Deefgea piscis]|uniref:TolC family protein n=1 Tax=Deefgea piscis TaxID=2739061 RepID=A0A6M8SVY5_9NEIS|nr:TolC family protein [Deefgea piscis]QKJ68294.1 TolC family protein [Deefgea piscis]
MSNFRFSMLELFLGFSAISSVYAFDQTQISRPTMPKEPVAAPILNSIELSLSDAIYLGLRNNRSISSAYLQRVAQKFDLRVAEDRFTPKLLLSTQFLRNQIKDSQSDKTADLNTGLSMITPLGTKINLAWRGQSSHQLDNRLSAVSFSVIQPLLRDAGWDVNMAPVQLAQLNEKAYRLSLKSTVSQTVTQIILAYRDFVRAQKQLDITQDALERSKQLLVVNKALISAGRMAEFEIVQTEADAATQELAVEEAKNQLDASRVELLRLLAIDLATAIRANDDLNAEPVVIDNAQAQRVALENQPEYLAQLIAGQQARINLKLAKNQRLWDVSLVGGVNHTTEQTGIESNVTNVRSDNFIGLKLEIPLGDLSRQQGEIQAQATVDTQALREAEAKQQLEQTVHNSLRDISTRWRQFEISKRAYELSLKKLDIERQKLKVGRSSNFQVLSFESDLRNAESVRLNALISYLNAQTQLDLKLGTTLENWQIAIND